MIDLDIDLLPIPLKRQKELRRQLETLEAYEDKTYLSDDFFVRNGFELKKVQNGIDTEPQPEYLYCDDVVEISAQCTDTEAGTWHVYVNWLDSYNPQSLDIYTLGQLRMFLAICGLDNLVEQFK